mgnify:CR=1 FL=1
MRGGKAVPYKHLVDESIRLAGSPPRRVIIVNRGLDPAMALVDQRHALAAVVVLRVPRGDLVQQHAVQEVDDLQVARQHLRQKLEDDAETPNIIVTEHGLGYKFVKPVAAQ